MTGKPFLLLALPNTFPPFTVNSHHLAGGNVCSHFWGGKATLLPHQFTFPFTPLWWGHLRLFLHCSGSCRYFALGALDNLNTLRVLNYLLSMACLFPPLQSHLVCSASVVNDPSPTWSVNKAKTMGPKVKVKDWLGQSLLWDIGYTG